MTTDFLTHYSSFCGILEFIFIVSIGILLFAYLPTMKITPYMNKLFQPEPSLSCVSKQSEIIGIIERSLYIILIVTGLNYIIIGWFALKALQNPFKEAYSTDPEKISKKYHAIVTGNGLSLLLGVVGGILTSQALRAIAGAH